MLKDGKIPIKHALWIDSYNKLVKEVPSTITTKVGSSNDYYVTIYEI